MTSVPTRSSNSGGVRVPIPVLVLFLSMLAGAAAWVIQDRIGAGRALSPPPGGELRVVSLSPAVTEVIFALGAQDRLIAVSDYCVIPEDDSLLVRAGTALTPNYETLARLRPTHILAEESKQAPHQELSAIAPTEMLPWLTLDEMIGSVLRIGEILDLRPAARSLADRLRAKLDVEAPADGPRVLLAMAHTPGQLNECWFIRDNSIHGCALRAAGARNAVPDEVHAVPRISLERVLELDPDVILMISSDGDLPKEVGDQLVVDWKRMTPLTAARNDRIGWIAGDSLFFTGPAAMRLADRLRDALDRFTDNTEEN